MALSNWHDLDHLFNFSNLHHLTTDFNFCDMQIKDGFAEGKDLVVTVMSSMGEEQICALKDIGPK